MIVVVALVAFALGLGAGVFAGVEYMRERQMFAPALSGTLLSLTSSAVVVAAINARRDADDDGNDVVCGHAGVSIYGVCSSCRRPRA